MCLDLCLLALLHLQQPVREAVSYRELFTAGWFGVREKHCSRLEIYDRLRASEQAQFLRAVSLLKIGLASLDRLR